MFLGTRARPPVMRGGCAPASKDPSSPPHRGDAPGVGQAGTGGQRGTEMRVSPPRACHRKRRGTLSGLPQPHQTSLPSCGEAEPRPEGSCPLPLCPGHHPVPVSPTAAWPPSPSRGHQAGGRWPAGGDGALAWRLWFGSAVAPAVPRAFLAGPQAHGRCWFRTEEGLGHRGQRLCQGEVGVPSLQPPC